MEAVWLLCAKRLTSPAKPSSYGWAAFMPVTATFEAFREYDDQRTERRRRNTDAPKVFKRTGTAHRRPA